jgi:hypothetical protein
MTHQRSLIAALGLTAAAVPLGNVAGMVQLNLSLGSVFTCTVVGDAVFQFTGWPAGTVVAEPAVIATQDGTGHSISYTGVTWLPSGSPPLFQTGAGQTNVNSFFSPDNGATVYGQGGSTTGGGFGTYGDGSDGAAVLDGTNTYSSILGKSGTTYWLLRDVYLSGLTIAAGVTLQLGGGATGTFRLLCNGTASIAATAFVTTSVNTAASGSTGGSNGVASSVVVGAAGPNGTTGGGVTGNNVAGANGGFGGKGGNASGGATTSGTNGVATMPAGASLPRALPWASAMSYLVAGTLAYFPGGASGSPGAGDGTNAGGGAGAGGNPLWMACQSLVNNGTIRASGGSGAAGTGGNAGGGGGGQGGPIVLIYGSYSGSGSIVSQGGNGAAGVGTGSAGASGGAGWIVRLTN